MQNFSLHTHTIGFDGKNTEEEMVIQAQNVGIKQLGFSNHFIVHNNIINAPMYAYAKKGNYHTIYSSSFEEAIDKFLVHYQKIDELKKNSDIKLLKGMEVDFFDNPVWREGFEKALQILKPDYLIGSAHFVEQDNILYNSHDLKAMPQAQQNMMIHKYWQNQRALASSKLFTFVAHLDLLKKVGLGQDQMWQEDEFKTVCEIKKSGLKVELNTSAFNFGEEPYPGKRIMNMLAEQNIPVLISDDAHNVARIGANFDKAESIAKSCGITNFYQLPIDQHLFYMSNIGKKQSYE